VLEGLFRIAEWKKEVPAKTQRRKAAKENKWRTSRRVAEWQRSKTETRDERLETRDLKLET